MGKLVHLSEADKSAHDSPEFLRHFGLSYCPFSNPGSDQSFWINHDVEDVRQQLNRALSGPGLLVISEPESQSVSPALALLNEALNNDVIAANLESMPDTPEQFLLDVLTAFGFESIEPELSECRSVMRAFASHSAKAGNPPVIVLQQAESFSDAVAEEIGKLLNLREAGEPCIRMILLGRPESINLSDVNYGDLGITHLSLDGIVKANVADFINGRLNEGGHVGRSMFTPAAVAHIADVAGGVPGVINQICSAAMLEAFRQKKSKVTKALLRNAVAGFRVAMPKRPLENIVAECISNDEVADKVAPKSADTASGTNDKAECPKGATETEKFPYFDMSRDGKHIARFRLDCGRLVIGRHKSNEIYVPSTGVSLFHAVVICDKNEAFIFDLRSTNGTYVNGRDVSRKRLVKGDEIAFGALRLTYSPGNPLSGSKVSNILDFAETVVLEEDENSDPTVYFRSGF